MSIRRMATLVPAVLVLVIASGNAVAEEPVFTQAQVKLLLQKLEQAEKRLNQAAEKLEAADKRIDSLEQQLNTVSKRAPLLPSTEKIEFPAAETIDPELKKSALYQSIVNSGNNSMSARLDDLEDRWKAQEQTNDELSSKLNKKADRGTSGAVVNVNGRIHGDYWAFPDADRGVVGFEGARNNPPNFDDPDDRFAFRRIRFGVKGDIKDNMLYKVEMEFADPNDTEYRDVYIGFKDVAGLGTVLFGNQKRPYGLDHLNSSRYNVFLERPFIVEAFNQDARRLGIASYRVTDDQKWNTRLGVYNLELTQNDAGYVGDHYQLEAAGRIANTWWYDETSDGRGYGHWAVSGAWAHPDGSGGGTNETRFRTRPEARSSGRWLSTGPIAGADSFLLMGLEGVFNVGPLQLVGEVEQVWYDRDADNQLYFWGGYGYISYFLTGEHIPWVRKSGTLGRVKPFENFFLVDTCDGGTGGGWGAWQVALRYSYADLSSENIMGGVGESLTFGLNWHWNPNSRMQFNYIYGTIDDRTVGLAPGAPTDGDYQIIGTRFMVDF